MTTPTVTHHISETDLHIEAQEREIEAKEEIIRLQADELADLRLQWQRTKFLLAQTRAELDEAVRIGTGYANTLRWAMPGIPLTGDFPRA